MPWMKLQKQPWAPEGSHVAAHDAKTWAGFCSYHATLKAVLFPSLTVFKRKNNLWTLNCIVRIIMKVPVVNQWWINDLVMLLIPFQACDTQSARQMRVNPGWGCWRAGDAQYTAEGHFWRWVQGQCKHQVPQLHTAPQQFHLFFCSKGTQIVLVIKVVFLILSKCGPDTSLCSCSPCAGALKPLCTEVPSSLEEKRRCRHLNSRC